VIPKTFSATALQIAEGCLARYKASVIDRAADEQGDAANVGIVLHGTLEHFVRAVFIRKDATWNLVFFMQLFHEEYDKVFGPNRDTPQYADAHAIAMRWYNDQENHDRLSTIRILSLEAKNSFKVPAIDRSTGAERPLEFDVNYIMDRVEQIGPDEYRVVDYKSQWVPLTHDQLREKIQARLYALAMQIIHKNAKVVWVEFDFLRFERIGVAFTKADNADTWRMLKRAVQRIVDTSDEDAEKAETINPECSWCVKKATCATLHSNVAAGGIHSLDAAAAGQLYSDILNKAKALKVLQEQLQDFLLKELITAQTLDLDLGNVRVKLKRASERVMDHAAVASILGPELSAEIGKFTLGAIDELMKSPRLSQEQRDKLEGAITKKYGMPRAEVTVKK